MSDLWPHGRQPTRLLCPRDFPGKNTEVGCHFLLQGVFPTQGRNPFLLHFEAYSLPRSHLGNMCYPSRERKDDSGESSEARECAVDHREWLRGPGAGSCEPQRIIPGPWKLMESALFDFRIGWSQEIHFSFPFLSFWMEMSGTAMLCLPHGVCWEQTPCFLVLGLQKGRDLTLACLYPKSHLDLH